jgi:hypothetical protein
MLAPGRRAWIQVVRGEVEVGTQTVRAGDALAVGDEDSIAVRARADAEVLLFDLA